MQPLVVVVLMRDVVVLSGIRVVVVFAAFYDSQKQTRQPQIMRCNGYFNAISQSYYDGFST